MQHDKIVTARNHACADPHETATNKANGKIKYFFPVQCEAILKASGNKNARRSYFLRRFNASVAFSKPSASDDR